MALNGDTKGIYQERVKLLKKYFKELQLYPKVININGECNVSKIIQSYLKNNPSTVEHMNCKECGITTRSSPTIILPTTISLPDYFQLLQINIINYQKMKTKICGNCKGIKETKFILGQHLFIETDINNLSVKLDEIPKTLNKKYV